MHVRKKSDDKRVNRESERAAHEPERNAHAKKYHTSDEDDNDVDMEITQPDNDDNHRQPIRLPGTQISV